MRFANYGRKSVYSDKSDSIDNQFRMCRDYCDARFPGKIDSWTRYSDEDFSGANTERPDLQRLLSDVDAGLVDALVVYQLDRLSRDVRDFSNIYSELEARGVMFISIKENIDTTTPIGRAMMYVTVVFAQMERETIAARVADNMLGLAKKGYWTGGRPPMGYRSVQTVIDGRKHVTLEPDPDGARALISLYRGFLDCDGSLQHYEKNLLKMGVVSPSGRPWNAATLWQTFTRPYAAEAVPEIYDYYAGKGCQMDSPRDQWNGTRGVMIYGCRPGGKNDTRRRVSPDRWILCVGFQKPIIPADVWLAVQAKMEANTFEKAKKYDVELLKGVVRCKKCGLLMKVDTRKLKSGKLSRTYCCARRARYGSDGCDCPSVKCEILNQKVLQVFRDISVDRAAVCKYVEDSDDEAAAAPPVDYKKQIADLERQLGRLATSIADNENSGAAKYIVAKMEELDLNLQALKREQAAALAAERARGQAACNLDAKVDRIVGLIQNFDSLSPDDRNAVCKAVLKECSWDGETLFLKL